MVTFSKLCFLALSSALPTALQLQTVVSGLFHAVGLHLTGSDVDDTLSRPAIPCLLAKRLNAGVLGR